MTNTKQLIFSALRETLHQHAVQEFQGTPQYDLLEEKMQKMDEDCYNMLREDERLFANECFDLLREVHGKQEAYLYEKGFQDCIAALKYMGVLA